MTRPLIKSSASLQHGSPCRGNNAAQVEARAAIQRAEAAGPDLTPVSGSAVLVTADASKVSGSDFFNTLFPDFAARREARREQDRKACIAAIKRGDTFGFPQMLVAECRQIIAEEDEATGWSLAERSAVGMSSYRKSGEVW